MHMYYVDHILATLLITLIASIAVGCQRLQFRLRQRTVKFVNVNDLAIRVTGSSRSLEMTPYDRSHTISYSRYIVTFVLAGIVPEIYT